MKRLVHEGQAGAAEESKGKEKKTCQSKEEDGRINSMHVNIDCCICNQLLLSNMFRCKNGHAVCYECSIKVNRMCTQCNCTFEESPGVNAILNSIKYPCKYSSRGCKERISFSDKHSHERCCPYTPCSCPVVECKYKGIEQDLSEHFRSQHPQLRQLNFKYNSLVTIILDEEGRKPFYTLLCEDDGRLFLLHRNKCRSAGYLMSIICIGSDSEKEDLWYELQLRRIGHAIISLRAPVQHMTQWLGDHYLTISLFEPSRCNSFAIQFRIWKQ